MGGKCENIAHFFYQTHLFISFADEVVYKDNTFLSVYLYTQRTFIFLTKTVEELFPDRSLQNLRFAHQVQNLAGYLAAKNQDSIDPREIFIFFAMPFLSHSGQTCQFPNPINPFLVDYLPDDCHMIQNT